MRVAKRSGIRGEGAFGTIVGIVLLVVVCYGLFKIVPLHISGNTIYDTMSEQANFAGVKPLDKITYEIFVKAQDEHVPLALNDIKIRRYGNDIIIDAKYTQSVNIFGYKYTYVFDRTVQKPIF